MKKSTLLMIVSLVLAIALGVGTTMAYLQDTDEDVNVMTLGNVYIEQIELERDKAGVLQEYTQGQPLYPAVYKDEEAWAPTSPNDPTTDPDVIYWADADENGLIDGIPEAAWNGMWKQEEITNIVDKFVFVKNTGKSDAYIRTIYAFEANTTDFEDVNGIDLIHTNFNGNSRFDYDQAEGYQGPNGSDYLIEDVEIDGVLYNLVVVTYSEPVAPGEVIRPSLLQVGMSKLAGNKEVEQFGETYDILVVSQAVQTQGFTSAQQALEAAFGVVSETSHPWMSKEDGGQPPYADPPTFPDLNAPVIPDSNWQDGEAADTDWYDASATEYELSTAAELAGFAKLVNQGTSFSGKTVKLANDIDLKDNCWTPIGQTGTSYGAVGYFSGNFDGQGHTIKNLYIQETNAGEYYAVGLFGFLDAGAKGKTIGNFTIDGANIKGHHWVGAAVGYLTGTLENVTVKNAVISSTHANDDACGDKTGAVVGYINGTEGKMINCSAIDSTVTSGRDAGQVVGSAKESQVVGCTATNVVVTATGDCTGANVRNEVIGRLN